MIVNNAVNLYCTAVYLDLYITLESFLKRRNSYTLISEKTASSVKQSHLHFQIHTIYTKNENPNRLP